MIIGIGSDLVSIPRIEQTLLRFGARFIARVYTQQEQEEAKKFGQDNPRGLASYYAKRFAAKEAFAKALGTGFRGRLAMCHIGITNTALGKPECVLAPEAQRLVSAQCDGEVVVHVSLSDDYPMAQAFVILERRSC